MSPLFAGNYSNLDTILLVVPQFHVMAWGFPFMSVWIKHVVPSSNLQPEVLIKILEDEKVTKANGVPTMVRYL
jgi:fatty-acyl-CoA synthase